MIDSFKGKRILALAPHTDDAELGCGGTLAKAVEEGAEVLVIAFCNAEQSLPKNGSNVFSTQTLPNEMKKAMRILGVDQWELFGFVVRNFPQSRQAILDAMIHVREQFDPDIVFLPCRNDTHQDHEVVSCEGFRAFKRKTMLGYEIPPNNLTFTSTGFVVLSQRHVDKKWAASGQYVSQTIRNPSSRVIAGCCMMRGAQVGVDYAEAFEVIRWVI